MTDQMDNKQQVEQTQEFEFLIEAIIENSKEKSHHQLEPFEEYVHSVQARFHPDKIQFCSRFIKGYHVLLEELASKK